MLLKQMYPRKGVMYIGEKVTSTVIFLIYIGFLRPKIHVSINLLRTLMCIKIIALYYFLKFNFLELKFNIFLLFKKK